MASDAIEQPFKTAFLSQLVLAPGVLPFTDRELFRMDEELARYEQVFLDPDIERSLITKNELLASFAISKAEDSMLTLPEAQEVYDLLVHNPDYDFIVGKLKTKQKLAQKDYEKLEFFNIAKTFRTFNQHPFSLRDLTPTLIRTIHQDLTQGLDIFARYIPNFTLYQSGRWRDNDTIRVGSYIPAPYLQIERGVEELISWVKRHQTPTGVAIFHTALYALHPFQNGNKRVCRMFEHRMLRSLGLNTKNLYSTSYYYHKEKPRYYKSLLYSLERKNLNHFTAFVLEAIVLSMISVVKASLEAKRSEFLNSQALDEQTRSILKPLVKRKRMQFKHLLKRVTRKMARQTFVTYLSRAVEDGTVIKTESGRVTNYHLNMTSPEEEKIHEWIDVARERLAYIPDDIKLL